MNALIGFLTENCCGGNTLLAGLLAGLRPFKGVNMKRLHGHVAVDDLSASIRFYSALFAAEPSVTKNDYANWMLDDPHLNFAISARGGSPGLNHLGVQVESAEELAEMSTAMVFMWSRLTGGDPYFTLSKE